MAASVVPAPGRFSMMKGLPSFSSSFCATRRANRSEPPPAANGTTMVTGRDGYCWAFAGAAARAKSTISAERPSRMRITPPPRLELRRVGGDMDQAVERAVLTVVLHRLEKLHVLQEGCARAFEQELRRF